MPESLRGLKADGPSPDILVGDWLNREYYDLLLETRSPKAANDIVYKTSMEIEKNTDENVYTWMQSYNFHEGLSWRITGLAKADEDTMFRPVLADYQDSMLEPADGMFQFEEPYPPDIITWYSSSGVAQDTYVRIPGSIEQFVTRTVIAGKYLDEDGLRYTFTEEGVAVWPDTTFTFQLSVDTVLSEGDYFYVGKTHAERTLPVYQSYGFAWDNDRLLLFETYETPDRLMLHQAAEPFAVLTLVGE